MCAAEQKSNIPGITRDEEEEEGEGEENALHCHKCLMVQLWCLQRQFARYMN